MQGSLIKFHILFHCLLDGEQFKMSVTLHQNQVCILHF